MCASRRSALWPQLVAISLIGLGAASCSSDSGRFSDIFGSNSSAAQRNDRVDSAERVRRATSTAGRCRSSPAPMPTAVPAAAAAWAPISPATAKSPARCRRRRRRRPTWTWEGGTPITVAPGETLETIARQHGVPVAAIMEANNITSPAMVHPGQHLVIPRYRMLRRRLTRRRRRASPRPRRRHAGRCAANRAGADRRRARRGARRDAAQHRAALRQAGDGARQGQQYPARHHGEGRRAHHHSRMCSRPRMPARPRRSPSRAAAGQTDRDAPNRRTARASPRLERRPPQDSAVKTAEPAGACRASAGRCAAASSPASVRSRTACRTTASISRCRKARRSRRPKTASSPMRATSSRATAIWCWSATQRLCHRLRACQRNPGQARRNGQTRPGDRAFRPDRQRQVAAAALRNPQGRDPGRSGAISQRRVTAVQLVAGCCPASSVVDAQPAGQILHILPGDAAGARAARRRPFERFAAQLALASGMR